MVDINTTLKELGQAFAGLSERFSGMEILGKLKKEKIKMANRITQKKLSRAVIQDLFGFEDIHKLQHIGISEAWRHSLKETDFTLKYTEDDRFYPLQTLSERETENYLQRYHEKFWDEEDGWVDRDLVEHLDMFFDNFSEELGGESRREFNGGIGVVSAGDLEHYEYTFHNAQECSQEVYFKPWGQISMSDMLREGGSPNPIWDKGNRFNRIPNALKGLLLVEAMQFWTNGNFMVGRTQKSDFNLYTDRVIWSTEKARKIAEFMRKLVDPLCEKLPRALIAAIKNLNPIAMADMNGLVSFKLHESDMTFYVYETGIDQIQDRKRYSFYAIPATYIDRTNTEEERREIFMSRLRAWKIIADFMMDCVVSPLSAEEIELREGQKELQALIEEYLKPKYVIGGPKDE